MLCGVPWNNKTPNTEYMKNTNNNSMNTLNTAGTELNKVII